MNLSRFLNKEKANQSLDERVKVLLAIGLFIENRVTLARAAALAGMSLSDFIVKLSDHNIPWMAYTEEDKKMMMLPWPNEFRSRNKNGQQFEKSHFLHSF